MVTTPFVPEYPDLRDLQHGDVLLPRRFDAQAISSFTDEVAELGEALADRFDRALPPWKPPGLGEKVDLIAYWPYLMGHLRDVRDGKLTIAGLFAKLFQELSLGLSDLDDLSQAIIAKQYVGHCAILDWPARAQPPWIIESSHTHGGLHAEPYEPWRAQREAVRASVWVYRLNALAPPEAVDLRRRFVDAAHALRMQGVRYAIFDGQRDGSKMCLDEAEQRTLGEPPYLYCSELVWLCARQVCGVDLLDRAPGAAGPRRFPMFTPKDITGSRHVSPIVEAHGVPYLDPIDPGFQI